MGKKPRYPDEFWQELADANPLGAQCDIEDVKSWFDIVWPKYSARGYRRHKQAIASWWSRIYEDDLQRAKERRARLSEEAEVARLEAVAEEIENEHRGVNPVEDHFRHLEER